MKYGSWSESHSNREWRSECRKIEAMLEGFAHPVVYHSPLTGAIELEQ
jgi:hypothetical protein